MQRALSGEGGAGTQGPATLGRRGLVMNNTIRLALMLTLLGACGGRTPLSEEGASGDSGSGPSGSSGASSSGSGSSGPSGGESGDAAPQGDGAVACMLPPFSREGGQCTFCDGEWYCPQPRMPMPPCPPNVQDYDPCPWNVAGCSGCGSDGTITTWYCMQGEYVLGTDRGFTCH